MKDPAATHQQRRDDWQSVNDRWRELSDEERDFALGWAWNDPAAAGAFHRAIDAVIARRTPAAVRELDPNGWEVDGDALVIIACSSSKLDRAAAARDLYTGSLFKASVAWARSWGLRWTIVSALHGIVAPGELIEPYDCRLTDVIGDDYSHLRGRVREALLAIEPAHVVVLGGQGYIDLISGALPEATSLWAPLQELPRPSYFAYVRWLGQNMRAVAA